MKPSTQIAVRTQQRLSLNAGLRASLHILQADAAGLTRYLEEQAAENPALRIAPAPPPPGEWLPRWQGSLPHGTPPPTEALAATAPSLMAHVMAEIDRAIRLPQARRIALALAEALEPSGWLGRPPAAIAAETGSDPAMVEAVLDRLQQIEPAGLFARDLADCLRLQAVEAGQMDGPMRVVLDNLPLLAAGEVARLARMADVDETAIRRVFARIRAMNPKPGAQFSAIAAPVREPDLTAFPGPEGWVVALNRSALPDLSVAPGRGAGQGAARALIRLVERRNATLLRVAQDILLRQTAALERGMAALVPMAMADVAAATGLHPSTVSRVVAGTAVDTPLGTWWLRGLFGQRMGGEARPGLSTVAIRARIAQMIAAEDPDRPLTDAALQQALATEGAALARRTVAKYREGQGLPPAHARRARPKGPLGARGGDGG